MKDDHSSQPLDNSSSSPEADDGPRSQPFDLGSLLEAIFARWRWVGLNTALFFFVGLMAALALLPPSYKASLPLGRVEPPPAPGAFTPPPLAAPALFALISSPEAFQRTASELNPPLSAVQLGRRLALTDDRNSELITVTATGRTPEDAVALANRFGGETVELTQGMQRHEAIEAGRLIARQLENGEADRAQVRQQLAAIETLRAAKARALRMRSATPTVAKSDQAEITRLEAKTQAARDDLADLQARYTEAHPLVREQQARLAALEAQLAQSVKAGSSDDTASLPPEAAPASADQSTGYDALASRLGALEGSQADLVAQQRAIELFAAHPPGYLRMMYSAAIENVVAQRNRLSIAILGLLGGALGALGTIAVVALAEFLDDRLKTGADVRRVTHLPLIATLGNLEAMSPAKQASWAFRTWTALQGRLSASPNHGMVCGFTSSGPGEGRSTWIALLSKCARQCGFTVLTISSSEANSGKFDLNPPPAAADPRRAAAAESTALAPLVTADPAELMERLTASNLALSTHLPLPSGWIWDLDRRKQWQRALNSWREIDHVVILVELPPVSDPEAVLLAENMPNLIWLAESHKARAVATIEQLETLRHARCRLVGAVLNREPANPPARFARWLGHRSSVLASAFGLMASSASAQMPPAATDAADPVPSQSQAAFAVADPAQRAPWQQRLTLGPGDLLNLSVFGQPELSQDQVPVGPDGRISYLEVQNVMAAGLTIDEFRAALNRELAKFRSAPEVIVIPAAYRSKKYYVLGAVAKKGAFTLDRPMTIIEAVAQAGGLEMGMTDHNLTALADLSRSFIARQGRHLPVDFERLFLQGDLSQNIALEPNDYLYFPLGDREEIYVLGEVRYPGMLSFSPATGTLEAIAVRGGFSERAWRQRLLVIRGSLEHPQTFVVNAADVLSAKTPDFRLQPRDIVYVSSRPWLFATDLLNDAASAFVQSAVITATGLHVDPIGDR